MLRKYHQIKRENRTAGEYQRFIDLKRENSRNLYNCKRMPKKDWNQERKDNKLMEIKDLTGNSREYKK